MNRFFIKFFLFSTLFSNCLFISTSLAASISASFQVLATLNSTCSINTSNLYFGTIGKEVTKSTASVNVRCSNSVDYSIAFTTGSSGTLSMRKMISNTSGNNDFLKYNLYNSDDGNNILGDGSSIVQNVKYNGIGNGFLQTKTIFGRVEANQLITPDNYSDIISVLVTY